MGDLGSVQVRVRPAGRYWHPARQRPAGCGIDSLPGRGGSPATSLGYLAAGPVDHGIGAVSARLGGHPGDWPALAVGIRWRTCTHSASANDLRRHQETHGRAAAKTFGPAARRTGRLSAPGHEGRGLCHPLDDRRRNGSRNGGRLHPDHAQPHRRLPGTGPGRRIDTDRLDHGPGHGLHHFRRRGSTRYPAVFPCPVREPRMKLHQLALLSLLGLAPITHATDWATPAEAAHFRTTPDYATTLDYLQRLVAAAPGKLKLERFGTTPQGRPMMAVVASGDGTFTPDAARRADKPIVLVQAGIHPGEIEGKDAGLMLLRDFAVTGKLPHLLDHAVLVYIPVFSVDGHEHSSPYNRINQNGPDSMGFRGQSQYLNLNRDYIKADAPEMRAWLTLWQHWGTDFPVDIHPTDGADYQYDLTWYLEDPNKLDPAVSDWQQKAMASVIPDYEKRGHLASIYLEFKNGADPRQGIVNFGSGPRFSTGYAALQNRPALLIETHMLKPYAVRVHAAYDLTALLLDYIDRDPAALLTATAKADSATIARAHDSAAQVALTFK